MLQFSIYRAPYLKRKRREEQSVRTSAARAAALLASLISPPDEPPSFWPWLLILGTETRGFDCGGGAEPTVRPGWEKGSLSLEGLPQRLPIVS